ncbi:glycosyltransferase [Rhodophyticola sp. CCM32]|uniref:glycosyltransferase n=1 Tax=Rhodophyticola sp. CCM32 TaxID=2916397 RepID=UPI00107F1331|nr:glycosyltransferase [Rhodophyticola sp. CCM32]QBY02516.1 glycosyltransferase [Rhodophyticola sp. CCM32]
MDLASVKSSEKEALIRIIVIGKFPPLQGGVSTLVWRSATLAVEAGHKVEIVTNSAKSVPSNMIGLGCDARTMPGLRVHQIAQIPERSFIPWARPDHSQLVGKALSLTATEKCDLLVGWYFEPYAVAAASVALLRNIPLAVLHAGSDVGRLTRYEELSATYKSVISKADYVIVSGDAAQQKLKHLGLKDRQVVDCGSLPVVQQKKLPSSAKREVSVADFIQKHLGPTIGSKSWVRRTYASCDTALQDAILAQRPSQNLLSEDTPIIAMFGKIHPAKGFEALLAAADQLDPDRHGQFRLMLNLSGDEDRVLTLLNLLSSRYPRLAKRTVLCPIAHPALMPELLGACSIVCILDSGFGIVPHQPRMAREALSAGAAVVATVESISKSQIGKYMQHELNCMIVDVASDAADLAGCMGKLLQDRETLRRLQISGRALSAVVERSADPRGPLLALINAAKARDFQSKSRALT